MEESLNEILEELQKDLVNSDIVQDNKIVFPLGNNLYRVRMPNQKDLTVASNMKSVKYVELLRLKDILTIKQITKLLKEKDVDISEIDSQIKGYEDEMHEIYLTMAKKKDSEEKAISQLKKELEAVRKKRMDLVMEKVDLLAPALENQVNEFYYKYLTFLCTEQYEEKEINNIVTGDWKSVWKTFETYCLEDSKLTHIALGKLTELIYSV